MTLFIAAKVTTAQVNVIPAESMYNGAGGSNGESITAWEANDRFENDPLLMSGSGDMRNTFASDFSGASGSWNVMLNMPGESFEISGIDASSFANISLQLGIRKSTLAEDGSGLLIENSADGVDWNALAVSLPTGTGTAGWHVVTATGTIPSASSLSFRITSITTTEFRIDDIYIKGEIPCSSLISAFYPSEGPYGTEVTIQGQGFASVTTVFFAGTPSATFQIISDLVIRATVPFGCTTGTIQLQSSCLVSSPVPFEVLTSSCALNGANLILSELCDPANNYFTDRYIEIFNPTAAVVDLDGWKVKAIANNTECETWDLNGTILPGEAKTCGYLNPVAGGPHDFGIATWNGGVIGSCCSNWNGNRRDGAALYDSIQLIDIAYYENSTALWFTDRSLIRSDSICNPNPLPLPIEWQASGMVTNSGDYPSTPGNHSTNCQGVPPALMTQPVNQTNCEGLDLLLEVSVSGGIPPYMFEWKILNAVGDWEDIPTGLPFVVINSGNGSSMTIEGITAIFNESQFYCKVWNDGKGCWAASNAAFIHVLPSPVTSFIYHY